jgi:alkylhydroperoxidase family enzyme
MQARLDPRKSAPEAMKALSDLHAYVRRCGLDHILLELIKLRASQINGCAWKLGRDRYEGASQSSSLWNTFASV